MLEQIYTAMKRNGTLRPADERKYGLYGRLGHASRSMCSSSQRLHHRQNGHLDAARTAADQCPQCSLRGSEVITTIANEKNLVCPEIIIERCSKFNTKKIANEEYRDLCARTEKTSKLY